MRTPAHTIRYSAWYYSITLAIVLLVGGLTSAYTYLLTSRMVKDDLLQNASAVAYALDVRQLAALSGTEADLDNPEYQNLKDRLMAIRATDANIRFVYLTGYRDGESFFFADSEPATSPDYSPPGQIYYEGSEAFREPFIANTTTPLIEDIYSDRWGTWLTALTPIRNPETDSVLALMGVDMNADEYYRTLWFYTSFPVGVTLFFSLMLTIGYLIRRREQHLLDFKAELVAIASHEIRTPLTGISWIAEGLLKTPGKLSEDAKNDIRLIETQSRELLLTVSDFLDLTAIENTDQTTISKQPVHLLPLLTELAQSFKVSLPEKNLTLTIDPSITNDVVVSGDTDRLKRMLANLISNAVKYSKPNGTITLRTTRTGDRVVLSVTDDGIGIAPADQSRIFGGYYRSTNAREHTEHGTGLGLRYVEQIAHLHGGKVWVESTLDKGSTFFIELPA